MAQAAVPAVPVRADPVDRGTSAPGTGKRAGLHGPAPPLFCLPHFPTLRTLSFFSCQITLFVATPSY